MTPRPQLTSRPNLEAIRLDEAAREHMRAARRHRRRAREIRQQLDELIAGARARGIHIEVNRPEPTEVPSGKAGNEDPGA